MLRFRHYMENIPPRYHYSQKKKKVLIRNVSFSLPYLIVHINNIIFISCNGFWLIYYCNSCALSTNPNTNFLLVFFQWMTLYQLSLWSADLTTSSKLFSDKGPGPQGFIWPWFDFPAQDYSTLEDGYNGWKAGTQGQRRKRWMKGIRKRGRKRGHKGKREENEVTK